LGAEGVAGDVYGDVPAKCFFLFFCGVVALPLTGMLVKRAAGLDGRIGVMKELP